MGILFRTKNPEPESIQLTSPPLSYSIASFNAGDFSNPQQKIDKLVGAGFKVLTLIPTYEAETRLVTSGLRSVVRRNDRRTPPIDAIRALTVAAIEAGMHVRFEPHIDAEVNLRGPKESYWRAHLDFDPCAIEPLYLDTVLKPLFDLVVDIEDIPNPNSSDFQPCFSLTLGSELERSIASYPDRWQAILTQFKALRSMHRLILGHKVNWDHFSKRRHKTPQLRQYLSELDYISVSFYVPLAGKLSCGRVPREKWQEPPTDESVDELALLMEKEWQYWLAPVHELGPRIQIGEAGIGNPDAARPYETSHPELMTTPEGRNVTRHFVRAVVRFAQKQSVPVTFWTVNQCDWLGLRPEWQRFRIDDLVEWVREYNTQG